MQKKGYSFSFCKNVLGWNLFLTHRSASMILRWVSVFDTKLWISQRKRNQIRKYFNPLISGPDQFEWWKKLGVENKKSRRWTVSLTYCCKSGYTAIACFLIEQHHDKSYWYKRDSVGLFKGNVSRDFWHFFSSKTPPGPISTGKTVPFSRRYLQKTFVCVVVDYANTVSA